MNSRNANSSSRQKGGAVNQAPNSSSLPLGTQQAIIKSLFGACDNYLLRCKDHVGNGTPAVEPGRRIEILRLVRDWTQRQLADAAGVSQTEVSRAESSFHSVKYESLKKICAALGTTIAEVDDPVATESFE